MVLLTYRNRDLNPYLSMKKRLDNEYQTYAFNMSMEKCFDTNLAPLLLNRVKFLAPLLQIVSTFSTHNYNLLTIFSYINLVRLIR